MGGILSREDIFYFNIINNEEASKCTADKVEIEVIDFIEAFKLKYNNNHDNVVLEQNKVLSSITSELLVIKKVLVYLGSDLVGLDVADESFESVYKKRIIMDIDDIDGYCDIIARKIMKNLEKYVVPTLEIGTVLSELDILYWYLNAHYQYSENVKDKKWRIVLSDVYHMINDFRQKFEVLLKIKNIYIAFFNYVLGKQVLTIEEKKNINIFFLQYEIVAFFDIFNFYIYYTDNKLWQLYCNEMEKEGTAINLAEYRRRSMSYCYKVCKEDFNIFFPNKRSLMLKLDDLFNGVLAPLTIQYYNMGLLQLDRSMCSDAGSKLFVDAYSDKSKYMFYFDSSIVDLDYVADLSVSLNYLLIKTSIYLEPFTNKYNAG